MSRPRQCGTKVAHKTRDAAVRALLHHARTSGANPAGLRAYKCPHCKAYHWGHRAMGVWRP